MEYRSTKMEMYMQDVEMVFRWGFLFFNFHSIFFSLSFSYTNPSSNVLTEKQVWNAQGTLLGKFFLGSVSGNFIFAGDGRLVILAETKIFLASIAAQGNRLEFP